MKAPQRVVCGFDGAENLPTPVAPPPAVGRDGGWVLSDVCDGTRAVVHSFPGATQRMRDALTHTSDSDHG
jgi:hypothetical protein